MNAALEVTLTLECIDGKDDHYKVDIGEGEKLILGRHSDGDSKTIEELETRREMTKKEIKLLNHKLEKQKLQS